MNKSVYSVCVLLVGELCSFGIHLSETVNKSCFVDIFFFSKKDGFTLHLATLCLERFSGMNRNVKTNKIRTANDHHSLKVKYII